MFSVPNAFLNRHFIVCGSWYHFPEMWIYFIRLWSVRIYFVKHLEACMAEWGYHQSDLGVWVIVNCTILASIVFGSYITLPCKPPLTNICYITNNSIYFTTLAFHQTIAKFIERFCQIIQCCIHLAIYLENWKAK